jgi:hypothetical protein
VASDGSDGAAVSNKGGGMSSLDGDRDGGVDSGGETEHRKLDAGGDDSKDLRHEDKGICFSTKTETGAGGEHDEDSTGRGGKQARDRQE